MEDDENIRSFLNSFKFLETHSAVERVFIKPILDAEGIAYFIQGE